MKTRTRRWLPLAAKILLVVFGYYMLHRCGLNPFWSVLVLMYWRTVITLGLLIAGLMYVTLPLMN